MESKLIRKINIRFSLIFRFSKQLAVLNIKTFAMTHQLIFCCVFRVMLFFMENCNKNDEKSVQDSGIYSNCYFCSLFYAIEKNFLSSKELEKRIMKKLKNS